MQSQPDSASNSIATSGTGITASVVLYNTPASQLSRLLGCIRGSSVPVQTYLVDNSPVPIDFAGMKESGIIYQRPASNRGYGAGHNIAIRQIIDEAQYHFVMNPDIYFGPEELEKMIRFMESDDSIGQLMPKVTYPDGSLQYLCKLVPGPADLLVRRFAFGPLKRMTSGRAQRFELRQTDYNKVIDVPYLSGCFMLFRTSALRRVGLFDERFFMYAEDIDITRRMHAQFRTVFFPDATIRHDHARESYKNARALWVHTCNVARYFNKWGWFRDDERFAFNRKTLERLSQN